MSVVDLVITYSVNGSKKASDRKTGMVNTILSKLLIRFSKAPRKSAQDGSSIRSSSVTKSSVTKRGN